MYFKRWTCNIIILILTVRNLQYCDCLLIIVYCCCIAYSELKLARKLWTLYATIDVSESFPADISPGYYLSRNIIATESEAEMRDPRNHMCFVVGKYHRAVQTQELLCRSRRFFFAATTCRSINMQWALSCLHKCIIACMLGNSCMQSCSTQA